MFFQNMPIFWSRNISYMRCKMLLLIGENMRNYSGFYQGLRPESLYFHFLSHCSMEMRTSKAKFLQLKLLPSPFLPSLKSQKDFFAAQKSLRALKNQILSEKVLFRVFSDKDFFRVFSDTVVCSVLGDRVLFGFLSDMVFFRFLSDKVF